MRLTRLGFLCGLMLTLLAPPALAEGDVVKGQALAREFCARCHNVEADGPFNRHPPSFAAIAVYRSDEQIFGRTMFPPLHSAMPQLAYSLSPDNVQHLVAYIRSLEKP